MTRETRHLKISNLPNGLADSKLLEYFSNYGRVQKVDRPDASSGSAVVSFIDIRTAAKAMASEHKVEGSQLRTSYYEPGSASGSSGAVIEIFESSEALNSASPRSNSAGNSRAPATGSSSSKESPSTQTSHSRSHRSTSRRRERSRERSRDRHRSGGGEGKSYVFRGLRGASRGRPSYPRRFNFRSLHHRGTVYRGRFPTRPWRGRGSAGVFPDEQRRQSGFKESSYSGSGGPRRSYSTNSSTGSAYPPKHTGLTSRQNSSWDSQSRNRTSRQNVSGEKQRRRRSSSGSSRPSKSPSHRSSNRSSVSPSPSVSSRGSKATPSARLSAKPLSSSAITAIDRSVADRSDSRRADTESPVNGAETVDPSHRVPLIIKNLPVRSTDSSIKEGLFFTYKKLGKVLSVKVAGENDARYSIVTFKKGLDVGRTIAQTDNEMFFGSQIRVSLAPKDFLDVPDNEKNPLEKLVDEHHPRSSRTLYIGNLDPRVTERDLKDRFGQFGFIVDVDIKNRDTPAPYAFVQYADITSVIKAIQETEHHNLALPDTKRVKVGFGKTLPTNIVWLDEIPDQVEESYLLRKMKMYGEVTDVLIDSFLHQALITYQNDSAATEAQKQLKARTRTIGNVYVQVDYGSAQLNDLFIDRMFRSKQLMSKKEGTSFSSVRGPPGHGNLEHPFQGENGPMEPGFGRKPPKPPLDRRPYTNNRDYDFPQPYEGGSVNGGGTHRVREAIRHRSKESSRGSDTEIPKDTVRRRPPSPPLPAKTKGGGSRKGRGPSASRSLPATRRLPQSSSSDSLRRRGKKGEGRPRKSQRSSSSSPESSSDSEDSSSSEGSTSESDSSPERPSTKKNKATKAPVEKKAKAPTPTTDKAINALENKKSAILQMLETLEEKPAGTGANPPPAPVKSSPLNPDSLRTPSPGNNGVKPKLGEVFDLGWQHKKDQPVVPTPVPPPAVSDQGVLVAPQPSSSGISGPYEDEDILLNQTLEEKEDSDTAVAFKKRRPKQFQPRHSSKDDSLGDESPVEVGLHPSLAADKPPPLNPGEEDGEKPPTTPQTAPPAASKHGDSGFFDSDDPQQKSNMKEKKQQSLDSTFFKKTVHHSPVSGSGGRPHHSGTQMIPLEQKPNFSGKDPRTDSGPKVWEKSDFPLPRFSVDCVFVTVKETSRRDSEVSVASGDQPGTGDPPPVAKTPVGRTVSGGSSSEDMALAMTSPEGSLPTPTRSGDELFGTTGKSPIAAFNNSSGSSPGRPSLEERIRALDAKFSALEQNMQAAKDKPASSANSRAVDISKYVVKRKQQQAASSSGSGSDTKSGGEYSTKSLYKSSIFDQDIERLKGLEEKYTPSTAALLSRSAEVKSEPLEDIFESLESKDSISFGSTKVKVEKPAGKKVTKHTGRGENLKAPLSISIPPQGGSLQVDTSKPPPVLPPAPVPPLSAGLALSPSMLISPPPQRGILKKPKTPTSAAPGSAGGIPSSSGPVFPPNLSIPPPPLPGPYGPLPGTPITPCGSGPVTPTDPRMAAKKDPSIRSPTSDPPTNAPVMPVPGARPNSLFHGSSSGFQKNSTPWSAHNRSGPGPPPHIRQSSYPMMEAKSGGPSGTVQPSTPKSAYNVDPRKQSFFASAPKREEKQFGLKHDRPPEASQPSIFQIMGVPGSSRAKHPSHKPSKELKNKELEELFRKQGQENKISEQRKELPKIKKKENVPVHSRDYMRDGDRKIQHLESREKILGERKKQSSESSTAKDSASSSTATPHKSGKEREKEQLKMERAKKERKEREKREREDREKGKRAPSPSSSTKQKPSSKKEEKGKKKKKARIFSSTNSSSEESEDSDSGSESDEDKKVQKSFEKEIQKILEEEALGGTSMYDRVKRRSSAARGDQKNDLIERQKEYLEAFKKQRDKQKGKDTKRRRIRMPSSSDENEEEEEEEEEKGEESEQEEEEEEEEEEPQPPPPKKHRKQQREDRRTKKSGSGKEKAQLNIGDVFGHGESSGEEETPKEKKKQKRKREKEESPEKSESEEEEAEAEEPPAKKTKVKTAEKPEEKEKKKRGRKPKTESMEKEVEKTKAKKKSTDTASGAEDTVEQPKPTPEVPPQTKKERREARRKEKEEKRKRKIEKLERCLEKEKAKEQAREAQESDSTGSGSVVSKGAKKRLLDTGGTPPLMTKAALKAAPTPVQTLEKEEEKTTLDTNEKVPSDIVEALKRSSNEAAETETDAQQVVLQEYAEEVQLEGVEPGDQVLVLGENGQVEQFEVQQAEEPPQQVDTQEPSEPSGTPQEAKKTCEPQEEPKKSTEMKEEPKETEVPPPAPAPESEEHGTGSESLGVGLGGNEVKEEVKEEADAEKAEDGTDEETKEPGVPAGAEGAVGSEESEEGAHHGVEDVKDHALLAEQRSDPSSHVDEVIDDVVHGYVEIDPEKLIKMTARQAAAAQRKSPTESQDIWNSVQAHLQQSVQQQKDTPLPPVSAAQAEASSSAAVQQVVDASHAQALIQQRTQAATTSLPPPVTASYEQLILQANLQQIAAAAQSSGMSPQLPVSAPSYPGGPHPAFPNPSALYSATPPAPYLDTQTRMILELQAQQKQAWGGLIPGAPAPNRLPQAAVEQFEHLQRLQQLQEQQRQQQQQLMATYQQQQQQQAATQQQPPAPPVPASAAPPVQQQLPPAQTAPAPQQQSAPHTPQTPTQPHPPALPSTPTQENPTTPSAGGGERILHKFPVKWQGYLALKTDQALVQMHYVSGNPQLIGSSLPPSGGDHLTSTLRISQRMRLEQQQLDGVQRRMHMPTEHCVLLALPCGHSADDIIHYSKVLHEGFINYLSQKQAAGIVNVNVENQCTFVVHIFPPCEFAQSHLLTAAPDFLRSIQERNTSFLFVVITTVN